MTRLVNFFILAAGLIYITWAQAETRFVDANAGDDAGGDNTCEDPNAPCLTIGQAVAASLDGDDLVIGVGVYTESIVIDKSLSLHGEDVDGTIVQASSSPPGSPYEAQERVITISDASSSIKISNLTVRYGVARGDLDAGRGGGIFNNGAALELVDVVLDNNFARLEGGGFYNRNASPTLTRIMLRNNSCLDDSGSGGGMFNANGSPQLAQVTFNGNTCQTGGGMYHTNGGTPTLDFVVFQRNAADNSGGGMHNQGGSPHLTNVVFVANSSNAFGGGMTNDGAATLANISYTGNWARFRGGGLRNSVRFATTTLTNVTFSGNTAGNTGGGIDNSSRALVIANSIFWNNKDSNGTGTATASIFNARADAIPAFWYSLAQGCNPAGTWNDSCGKRVDGNLIDQNPMFIAMPNPDHAPAVAGNVRFKKESPAIDGGDNDFVLDVDSDLDGLPRIMGEAVDLGPYEYEPPLFEDRFESE